MATYWNHHYSGRITIIANAIDESGIEGVEFYVDDNIKFTDCEAPYSWLWNEFAFGKHEIKVVAYGNASAEDRQEIWIFNI